MCLSLLNAYFVQSLQPLSHGHLKESLVIFNRYFHERCLLEIRMFIHSITRTVMNWNLRQNLNFSLRLEEKSCHEPFLPPFPLETCVRNPSPEMMACSIFVNAVWAESSKVLLCPGIAVSPWFFNLNICRVASPFICTLVFALWLRPIFITNFFFDSIE